MISYNLAIVDDHKLFRTGLITLLEGNKLIKNIYEASNGENFLTLLNEKDIDIALMDIDMPGMNGIETTQKALMIKPELKIISLSMYKDDEYYYKMINAGAKGFLVKDTDIEDLLNAIKTVGNGENYFSSDKLYNLIKHSKSALHENDALTEREMEVLNLICKGLSNQKIAEKLIVSKRTIDKHRENILSKTGCNNTASLIMYANKNRLI
ncbi:MAG: DNA-binding response regulator [Bacteroidetes bacterium GWA2_30_7]|nr:MAG: DNA-binding response regulator [Bacteroidetes bacterium GWA2_30_7]